MVTSKPRWSLQSGFLALAALSPLAVEAAPRFGPGIGNLTYQTSDLYKSLYAFHPKSKNGDEKGMNVVSMYKGYLLFGYGNDSGNPGGGFAFYDVSNPRSPTLVFSLDVNDLRESHAYGFHTYAGKDYFAAQSIYGVHIYEVTDPAKPVLIKDIRIPGVFADDYDHAAWWLNWQAPYLFVSRGADGFSIINTADLANPQLMNIMVDGAPQTSFPISKSGNFQLGPIFAVGNLLVLCNNRVGNVSGIAALDISNPTSPKLLAVTTQTGFCYSMFFNGGEVVCVDGRASVWEVAATTIKKLRESGSAGAGGEYVHVQDNWIHMGAEDRYAKIDRTSMAVVNNSFQLGGEAQEGFCNPMGNLVLVTDDHGIGSSFVPHEAQPDKTPPEVNFLSPKDGAVNQAVTSRVGVTFTDQIDVHSIDTTTFIVRPLGGKALSGRFSSQTNIVNFSPESPLQPNTTYEVVLSGGGIRDYMGNQTVRGLNARFSTGSIVSPIVGGGTGGGRSIVEARTQSGGGVAFRISGAGRPGEFSGLTLSDIRGNQIRQLDFQWGVQGETRVVWNGLSADGRPVGTGIYFARLRGEPHGTVARFLVN